MTIQAIKIDPEHGRDEWLAMRKHDVTASVAAALLGVHPYQSRYSLWQDKAGMAAERSAETAAMLRGRMLEAPAINMLSVERSAWKVWQPNVYLRDPATRLGATPDAYAIDPDREGFGIVQIKTSEAGVFRRTWRNEDGDVEPPLWIVVQAIVEAHMAGAKWAVVAALVVSFGIELHIVEVPLHKGVIDRVIAETQAFWASIEANQPPPPDYGADAAMLAAMYARDNGQTIDLSGDNRLPEILAERAEIKARVAADLKRASEIEAEVVDKLGDNTSATLPGWKISRPTIKRKAYQVEAGEYRRLTVRQIA